MAEKKGKKTTYPTSAIYTMDLPPLFRSWVVFLRLFIPALFLDYLQGPSLLEMKSVGRTQVAPGIVNQRGGHHSAKNQIAAQTWNV